MLSCSPHVLLYLGEYYHYFAARCNFRLTKYFGVLLPLKLDVIATNVVGLLSVSNPTIETFDSLRINYVSK